MAHLQKFSVLASKIESKLEREKEGEMLILIQSYREMQKGEQYGSWVIGSNGEQKPPDGFRPRKDRGKGGATWEGQMWWNDVSDLIVSRDLHPTDGKQCKIDFVPKYGIAEVQRAAGAQLENELNLRPGSFELDRDEATAEQAEQQVSNQVEQYIQQRFDQALQYTETGDWPINYNYLLDKKGISLKIRDTAKVSGISEEVKLPGVGTLELHDEKYGGSFWLVARLDIDRK